MKKGILFILFLIISISLVFASGSKEGNFDGDLL